MQKLLETYPVENFTPPGPITDINPVLLGQTDPNNPHSILYYINKDNPLGPAPQNPADEVEYLFWEVGVQNWLNSKASFLLEEE